MPLLVHLDRVNAAVLALIVVLAVGVLKRLVNLADAVAENVGETEQNWQLDAAGLELIDEFLQIDGVAGALVGVDGDVTGLVNAEVALAPVANAVGLDGIQDFRSAEFYGHLPPDKVVALCTGSQGEPRAALARIADDEHPDVTLGKGDRVIFSSRTIPGNEKAVGRVLNGLIRQGIEVITDRTHLVHVSGHPRRAEMEELYRWVRPRVAIPVHGEALHLSEHAKLARAAGVPEVVLCGDGDLVRLAPNAGVIDEVPAARLYKDGAILISAEQRTVAERRRLSFSGIAIVAMALSDKGQLLADPDVELIGIPEVNADKQSMHAIAYDAVIETFESLPKPRRRDPQAVEESIKRAVRAAIAGHWQKKPISLVQVLVV